MRILQITYKVITKIYLLFVFIFILSCHKQSNQKKLEELSFETSGQLSSQEMQLAKDDFPLTGTYHWKFKLMGVTQHSIHIFYPNKIEYIMKGKVHSTQYTMKKISYQKNKNKWIGKDDHNTVYVLFFKNQSTKGIEIYKRKCKDMAEAVAFDVPPADATTDHGWNVYYIQDEEVQEKMTIVGNYIGNQQEVFLSDNLVVYDGKDFNKLSFHQGERRWVGQNNNTYLQVFFKDLSNEAQLYLAIDKFHDLEKVYKTKYNEGVFKSYQRKENSSTTKGKKI